MTDLLSGGDAGELEGLADLLLRRPRVRWKGVGQPAAGADWTDKVISGANVRIVGITATLTTAVAVATRIPALQLKMRDGSLVAVLNTDTGGQAASLAHTWSWVIGASAPQTFGTFHVSPLPDVVLPDGATVGTVTTAIQAADQWSAIVVSYDTDPGGL